MNKFYPVITVAVIAGIGLIMFSGLGTGGDDIRFSDLETECRISDEQRVDFELNQDNTMRFSGHYPIENTDSDLSYSYTQNNNLIRLKLENTEVEAPEDFENNCLASVRYRAETQEIEPGTYFLEIYHDDERVKRNVIQIS